MPHVNIYRLVEDDPAALYLRYPGQENPQPCVVSLDLETGELAIHNDYEVGSNAVPMSVWNHRVLWFGLDGGVPTTRSANEILDVLEPIAEEVLAGASIEWDGNNNVGRLTSAAADASERLAAAIPDQMAAADLVDVLTFDGLGDLDALGVTADTDIGDLIEELRISWPVEDGNHLVIADDVREGLVRMRDEERANVREELAEAVEEERAARIRRDVLIRRLAGWGDSARSIAELAELTHPTVGKIIADSE